jgi:class 3 adenylate cyclase/pimeloyl-ACP methyl ester carboxylesterase
MEPEIRYVRSANGTKIATASIGSGTPVLVVPGTSGHIEAHFSLPEVRATVDFFAERYRFVTYDPRGRGLSDRNVSDWSLDARVADARAVFAELSLPPSFVLARAYGSLVGIVLAARHPELVRRLGLYTGVARGSDVRSSAVRLLEAIGRDWPLFCKVFALIAFDWTESGPHFAELLSTAFTLESFRAVTTASQQDDVSDDLDKIGCPVLIIQPRESAAVVSPEATREIAARLKDARFQTSALHSWLSPAFDTGDARAFAEFFGEDEPDATDGVAGPSGTAIILFTDIVDSTALTERLGDTVFRTASRALDEGMRTAMRESGGTPVEGKVLGDGVMGVFTSASQAIDAARRCIELSAESELRLHVGLHAGDVSHEGGNVYGGAVNIASRICGLSAPGEILVSDIVRGLARTSAGVEFADRGDHALKGIDDAVRVYEVRWQT